MALSKSRLLRWLIPPLVIVIVAVAAHPIWLGAIGDFLVASEEPFRAEMIVVLAGGYAGNRILKGAELVKQGYAPKILVSGPEGFYGRPECELAIAFAIKQGYPAEWFIPLPNRSRSTREEAEAVVAELRRRGVRRFLVVTSNYHTRRAREVYHDLAPEAELHTVAAPDTDYNSRWWRGRHTAKTVVLEWSKTVAYWLGM